MKREGEDFLGPWTHWMTKKRSNPFIDKKRWPAPSSHCRNVNPTGFRLVKARTPSSQMLLAKSHGLRTMRTGL
ncbi:hypothetical protein O181_009107 [Austropuccinia psidii MF-1]|uniref:Uncharacterized protein n=1 Tax=Austropuccinia psidii MF-1 TaxID=1389203 RepID=A0A9Q3GK05_9BASI|nr:hypothetical protein [Austropuccinia psidii MF-1]